MFALGIASGKFNFFKRTFDHFIARKSDSYLFKFPFAKEEILEPFFFEECMSKDPEKIFYTVLKTHLLYEHHSVNFQDCSNV